MCDQISFRKYKTRVEKVRPKVFYEYGFWWWWNAEKRDYFVGCAPCIGTPNVCNSIERDLKKWQLHEL